MFASESDESRLLQAYLGTHEAAENKLEARTPETVPR